MDKKQIDITAIGIIVIIFLAFYFLLFRGERLKYFELKKQESSLSEKLKTGGGTNLEMDKMTEEIRSIQADLDLFEKQLPGEKRIHQIIRTLDQLARKQGVELRSISPGDMIKEHRYARIPVTINALATFQDFYAFLYALERMPRITRIQSLNIERKEEKDPHGSGRNICNIQMNLAVFVSGGKT